MIRINGNAVWFSSVYSNDAYQAFKGLIERTAEKIDIPEGTRNLQHYCLAALPIKEITIPASVQTIGENVFRQSTELQKIVFAPRVGVPKINSNAFYWLANDGRAHWDSEKPCDIYVPWGEGEVAGAPWGAGKKTTIHYNHK